MLHGGCGWAGEKVYCFGHYLNPKCRVCKVEPTCMRATLGSMVERGSPIKWFDTVRGELIYPISERGRRQLEKLGLLLKRGDKEYADDKSL